MKTKILSLTLSLLLLFSAFLCVGCKKEEEVPATIWDTAVQKEDATLGNGAKTVTVKIEAGEKSITLTIKTDKSTLSEAMKEHGLLAGEDGFYDTVNGIYADYSKDKSYWELYKDGERTFSYGADDATVTGGEEYAWVYTK